MSGQLKPSGIIQCEIKNGNMIELPADIGLINAIYYQSTKGLTPVLIEKSEVSQVAIFPPTQPTKHVTVEYYNVTQLDEYWDLLGV